MFRTRSLTILQTTRRKVLTAKPGKAVTATRALTIGGDFAKKEKVEEDRYMRELEREFVQRQQVLHAAERDAAKRKEFADTIAPVMAEAHQVLTQAKSSVTLDDSSLEALAPWKLGKPQQ